MKEYNIECAKKKAFGSLCFNNQHYKFKVVYTICVYFLMTKFRIYDIIDIWDKNIVQKKQV